MIALAVAAAEPHRGWGGPLAILLAFAGIGLVHIIVERRKNLSPTPRQAQGHRANPQVSEVPDTSDTEVDTGWLGRIVTTPDGTRVRQILQVWRTGSTELPADEPDGELDLDLTDYSEPEDLNGWVRDNLDRLGYADLVRAGMRRWQVSERTMKRRIADAKSESGGTRGRPGGS